MQTQKAWIGIAIIALVIVAIFGYQYLNLGKPSSTLNAAGTSELIFKPDQAKVWVGISVLKPNAEDAQNEANKVIGDMIDGLRYKGIKEEDIQTENINLYEEQEWTSTGQKSKGWRAVQTLKIKTTDFSKVGSIVDIAVKSGANEINNIEFSLTPEKEAQYKKQSIADATKNAREKAEAMASGSGAKLGKVISISESSFNYYPYRYDMMNKAAGTASVAESAAVMPKDVTVTANINLVYEIK
jgi:uncharacterized protein YggE